MRGVHPREAGGGKNLEDTMKFRSKTMFVESVTFEELVEHAKANGAKLMNGVPWSFDYKDAAVTHENDDCYVVTRPTQASFNFYRGDRLVTRADGIMDTMELETFLRNYEPDITCLYYEELRNDPRSRDVIFGIESKIGVLETDLHQAQRERGRARSEAAEAKQKVEQHQRALRDAAAEFNLVGIRTTIDILSSQPIELPGLVRRLGRTVREVGPDRDALRLEVRRLNGEILDHPKAIAAKDAEIAELGKKIDAGGQREKALESTIATMQPGRDAALAAERTATAEKDKAVEQLARARAKVAELEGTVAKLQTSAKPEVKVA